MEKLRHLYRLAFAHKISSDLVWTFGSFATLAVSGVLINLVIAFTRDAAALGVFNIAYAVYLIGSQIASLGIHYSVLRHATYYQEDPEENGRMLCTAITMALVLGFVMSVTLYYAAPFSEALFASADVAASLQYAALGVALFPLNKVLICYANALRQMKAFAVLQSIRYITVVVVVTLVCVSDWGFNHATLSFLAAELLTSACCIGYLASAGLLKHLRLCRAWLRKHLVFGSKAVFAGIFLDLNTRLDVLVLGMMMNEHAVGIYSFAAMLIDGIQHILAIIRVNFNPILVKALRDADHRLAQRMLQLSKRFVALGTAVLSLCMLAGFLVAVHMVIPGKGLEDGLLSLCILLGGFTLISGFAPFDNVPMISGHPGYQTAQSALITLVNIVLCLSLVPVFGIAGAAMATIAGYIAGTAFLLTVSPRLTGWDLLRNRFVSEPSAS